MILVIKRLSVKRIFFSNILFVQISNTYYDLIFTETERQIGACLSSSLSYSSQPVGKCRFVLPISIYFWQNQVRALEFQIKSKRFTKV